MDKKFNLGEGVGFDEPFVSDEELRVDHEFINKFPSEIGTNGFPMILDFIYHRKDARIKVQNAGLLLLHPFLENLFFYSGILVSNEQVIPSKNLSSAAVLLHYLATGHEKVDEFELGFIKILLGLDPDQPLLITKGLLTQYQKEEAEIILTSAIGHLSLLKNTSINDFRDSFIRRSAVLYRFKNGWKVQMERAPLELLLCSIPWPFSIIKLPWMKATIYFQNVI